MAVNLITAIGLRFRSLVKKSTVYSNADMRLAYQRSIKLAPVGVAYGRRSRGA